MQKYLTNRYIVYIVFQRIYCFQENILFPREYFVSKRIYCYQENILMVMILYIKMNSIKCLFASCLCMLRDQVHALVNK